MSFTKFQKPTLESRERNNDQIVAQFYVQNTRMYTSFPTKDAYAQFILSKEEGSDTCNELIFAGAATFLDIDCPLQLSELGFQDTPDFVSQFNTFLMLNYETLLGVELSEHQILWSTSTRPEKTSFHITIKNPCFFLAKRSTFCKIKGIC